MSDALTRDRPTVLAVALLTAMATLCPRSSGAADARATVPSEASVSAAAVNSEHSAGIAWHQAATDADVDAAFGEARAQSKPVFVYWGAKWCPPCNQVKATLFNRQDFIARSRAFVPVYVDGDSPGAQKLGARFKVSGYPTMLLFDANGVELTRLPGEVDAARYTEVLTLGMAAHRSVKELLAQAQSRDPSLSADEWRLLAYYSWDTDEQQLVSKDGVAGLLEQLADACAASAPESALRLRLKSLAARDEKAPARADAPTQAQLLALLSDPQATRSQMDLVTNDAADITRALSVRGSPQRAQLTQAFAAALKRLESDLSLSRADRIDALIAQVDLARIDEPKRPATTHGKAHPRPLPAALIADIRLQVERADRETHDGYERQAVITAAAYLLQSAGLSAQSDALLKANLSKSHSPYYLMSELAGNAKARGDTSSALHWYEAAFTSSVGPATRLQWGAGYVGALVELAPGEEGRIERVAAQLLDEAALTPDAFYERSGRSLQRMGKRLQTWNQSGTHQAVMGRLEARLQRVCAALDAPQPQREQCKDLFQPARPAAV